MHSCVPTFSLVWSLVLLWGLVHALLYSLFIFLWVSWQQACSYKSTIHQLWDLLFGRGVGKCCRRVSRRQTKGTWLLFETTRPWDSCGDYEGAAPRVGIQAIAGYCKRGRGESHEILNGGSRSILCTAGGSWLHWYVTRHQTGSAI